VLNELRARRVLTSSYVAVGYGETRPIAPNDTEEGREANRRIEFRLIRPETNADEESTLDMVAEETPVATGEETDGAAELDDEAPVAEAGGASDANGATDEPQAETGEATDEAGSGGEASE